MKEVIINVGVSGSGKTTYSIDRINKDSNIMRINRDDIRRMLVGTLNGYWRRANTNEIESYINDLEELIFMNHVSLRYSIIIDNTNLNSKYIKKWITLVENWNRTLPDNEEKYEVKIKIFDKNSPIILKDRVKKRDSLSDNEVKYIDNQISALDNVLQYIVSNHQNLIINE